MIEKTRGTGPIPVNALLKSLLFAYLLTAGLLALLALLLFKAGLDEKIVSIAIIAIYVASTFLAGFLAGKRIGNRRFLWGLLEGTAYFVVLAVISLAYGGEGAGMGQSFVTTLVLCAAGGMLGGMVS